MAKQNTATTDTAPENANGTAVADAPEGQSEQPTERRDVVVIDRGLGKEGTDARKEFKGEFPVPTTAQEMINTWGDDLVQELARQALGVRLGAIVVNRLKAGMTNEKITAVVNGYDPTQAPKRGPQANSVARLSRVADKITSTDELAEAIAALEAKRAALLAAQGS